MDFPHISDNVFPNVPSALEPVNDFDYERWSEYETKITLCNAPWGTSEVQVGQRVTGGLGKVVKFANDRERDKYFNSLPNKLEFTTPYRGFSQTSIQVNLPFDMLINYNYCYIEYSPATSEDVLLDYEGVDGVKRIYFFIRDLKYRSPSNSELILLLDYWTTFINSIEWLSLGLERGHAPVKAVSVDSYISNPIENCELLLHEDVTGNNPGIRSADSEQYVFNAGTQYVLISSSADMVRTLQNGRVKTLCNPIDKGDTFNFYSAAVAIDKLEALINLINTTSPQFIATIQGLYIIENTYLNLGTPTTVGNIPIYPVNGGKVDLNASYTFTKNSFKFDDKYKKLAKLYTYPYSYLEVTDWRGGVHVVRVEDCPGTLTLETMSNIAAPFVAIQAAILGIGGGTRNNITFKNVKTLHYYSEGREHDYTFTWPIPCYAVTQQPSIDYEIHTVHDRAQRAEENATNNTNTLAGNATDYANNLDNNATNYQNTLNTNGTNYTNDVNTINTDYNNNVNTNNTNNANALDTNSAVHTNQANNIARIKANLDDEQFLQTRIKALNNGLINSETENNLSKLSSDASADIITSMSIEGAENEATAVSAAHNQAMGVVGQAAMGAVTGATAGSIVPGAGTVAGAIVGGLGGAAAGIVGAEQIGFTSMVSQSTNSALAEAARDNTRLKVQAAADHATISRDLRTGYNDSANAITQQKVGEIGIRNRDTDNTANNLSKTTGDAIANRTLTTNNTNAGNTKDTATTNAGNTKDTADTNAGNTKDTADGIAARTKETADANANRIKVTADNAIQRAMDQAGLAEPRVFGNYLGGNDTNIKPIGLDFSIITQDKASIAYAGEQFLRYGYYVNRWVDFTTFNLCDKFTYWKCFDFVTGAIKLPDAFVDRIKALLLGGITVYSKPEYITEATLYNNGI